MNAVAFADSSSQLLFSGSDDAVCKVWDRRMLQEDRPQPVGQLAGHRDGITFIHSKVEKRCCWHFIWIWLKMINYKPKLATVHSFRVQPNSLRGSQVQFVSFFSFFSKIWFLCVCVSTGPGRCTLSDQQLKGPVHQTLGHQKILTQGRPGSLTSGCHTSKLGLPLAAGSTKRWGRKGLRCQASEVYMYVIIMGLHYKVRVWMLCSRFLGQRWNLDKVIFFHVFYVKNISYLSVL